MGSNTKKAIVSACLLGEFCRYDGKTKQNSTVIEALRDYEIIPFCPEAPLFGTPRERIDVVKGTGKKRIVTHQTGVDVTQKLTNEIKSFIQEHPNADIIVLKSKSPSCGLDTTPIYDVNKELTGYGNGLAADLFKEHYLDTLIVDEHHLPS